MSGMIKSRSERGSVSVELVIVVPALVLMLGLMITGGRIWFARTTVAEAAYSAARAASLARGPGQAVVDGKEAGRQALVTQGLDCKSRSIRVGTSAFNVPIGQPATVTTSVTCVVSFGEVSLPGFPGSMRLSADGAAALDTYRTR